MPTSISSRLPEIIAALKLLKNAAGLAPLVGDQLKTGIELVISICEMAQVSFSSSSCVHSMLIQVQNAKDNKEAYEALGLRMASLLAGISNIVQKAPENRLPLVKSNLGEVIR
jgi:hypothetical protein